MASLEGSGCVLSGGGGGGAGREHGNAGMWMIFSPLTTSVGTQEAEQAADSAPVQQLEELATGSDQDDTSGQESSPSPGVVPPQVAAPAAAVLLGSGCAASADMTEAQSHVPEEFSLEPPLFPATGEELALQSALGPVLELRIIPPALPHPPEVVLLPLFDLLLLYCLIVSFSLSPQHS